MVKIFKNILILLFLVLSISVTYAFVNNSYDKNIENQLPSIVDNYPYITEQLLKSSRYTQEEEKDLDRIDNYLTNYVHNYSEEELLSIDFIKVLENENFELYFNNLSFSIMLRNKVTNYLWSSINLNYEGTDGNRRNRNNGNSGLMIDFVRNANVRSSDISNESILTLADARYFTENDNVIEELLPYSIDKDHYDSKHHKVVIKANVSNNTLKTSLDLKDYGFKFNVDITLTNKGFDLFIDKDSIIENDPRYSLLNIHIFPNLGATREDKVPGYFVIPDGIGALVRLDKQYNQSFNARFFGNDVGYNQNHIPELSLPIFGVVHQNNQNAFYAEIKEGAENTNLQATFWGANTKYNKIYPRYSIRNIYRTVISKAGDGRDAILEQIYTANFDVSYNFLNNDDANYVGIARDYQESLINSEILFKNELKNNNQIPLLTSYIISEQENSFIGTNTIKMTNFEDIDDIYNNFKDNNINNQVVNLYGWSKDGFVNKTPYRMNLVYSEKGLKNLSNLIHDDNNLIYLNQNYKIGTSLSNRINYYNDVSYRISRVRMSFERKDINDEKYNVFYIKPSTSLKMAISDNKKLDKLLVDGLSLEGINHGPFSFNNGNDYYDRTHTLNIYQEIGETLNLSALYNPSSYMFKYMNLYLNLEISNSQFDYYTDLVPLVPIVLKGYTSYFSTYLNFNSIGKDKILNLIDFGINPSYVLTKEDTYKLRFTLSNRYYTTSINDFNDDVINNYTYINNALKHVLDASIVNREVLDLGIVLVTYSNNVKILINYSNNSYSYNGKVILSQDYEVFL